MTWVKAASQPLSSIASRVFKSSMCLTLQALLPGSLPTPIVGLVDQASYLKENRCDCKGRRGCYDDAKGICL